MHGKYTIYPYICCVSNGFNRLTSEPTETEMAPSVELFAGERWLGTTTSVCAYGSRMGVGYYAHRIHGIGIYTYMTGWFFMVFM